MPRYSANLSFLFGEHPFLDRFAAAAEAGFTAVEYMFPYEHPAAEVKARLEDAGLEQALFNLPAGDWAGGDRGIAADPARVEEFREGVGRALEYAEALNCPRMNCLAGLRLEGVEQWDVLVENVRWAASRLAAQGRTLLVEHINDKDVPGFLLPTTSDVVRLLDAVGDPAIRLQFDVYHAQRMEGDLVNRFRALRERIGHVQIADNPGRHQPGTGEIDFPFVLAQLDASGYKGFVGLEYVPEPDTLASLAWLARKGEKV